MRYRLTDATPADEAWLDELRRRAYAALFDATWGGWDARAHGRSVCLRVGLKNEAAIRLYERLGFDSVRESETHCHMRYSIQG